MNLLLQSGLIFLLILISMFFSISEISLAAARKMRLRQLADDGSHNARLVLALQAEPGHFFTVVQIGVNAVAILAGIVGESALSPYYSALIGLVYQGELLPTLGFLCSFLTITALFILIADLFPKRLGLLYPERIALIIVRPMVFCVKIMRPLVWLFNGACNLIFRLFNIPIKLHDSITQDDIVAVVAAGAEAGALQAREHQLIENVFELESRTVGSSMTQRESIIWLPLDADDETLRRTFEENPHSKYLVCRELIDQVVGYIDIKDMLVNVFGNQALTLKRDGLVHNALLIPDTLTLSEVLESFKTGKEDFAVILNEYGLVVGIITLNDVLSTVMGDLVSMNEEEQIVKRDEQSWLIDGLTPIEDVLRALDIDEFPDSDLYETIAGFMMYRLHKIPKRTDSVVYAGYSFEVVDIDNNHIDQLLVTRVDQPTSDSRMTG